MGMMMMMPVALMPVSVLVVPVGGRLPPLGFALSESESESEEEEEEESDEDDSSLDSSTARGRW
ncbi:ec3bd815-919d-43f2-a799-be341bdba9b0 [Thermothielavioides terrestris]|uniref:Ec3bd815-919d-43f2-a799-be341bdba9b0 n=1 Tax=Thermothielavioides terrestris TaxID=2587410 RepID=A0A3S4AZS1_9PEZI|nr:ec3bd815-919d-43f2-a799-be341bdba9b0 [Thermothielavioides terrestris]